VIPDGDSRETERVDGPEGRGIRTGRPFLDDDRGQMVLLAAGVVAVALIALVVAYLQLGYHADVRAGEPDPDPGRNAERVLSRAVHEAGLAAQGRWTDRVAVVEETRDRLAPRIDTLEAARIERGTAYVVEYNRTAARDFAATRCPGGPDRQFGPCRERDGVVIQERVDETHVLAVAFDVTITTERGTRRLTLVVGAVGGPVR